MMIDIDEQIKYVNDEMIKGTLTGDKEKAESYKAIAESLRSLNQLSKYFKSGNDIPVERATIKAKDFHKITNNMFLPVETKE